MSRKIERQRELRALNRERYREYERTPARVFSKAADATKRKIMAFRKVAGPGPWQCTICGDSDLLHLTIDHRDESGSERNLYFGILKGTSSQDDKQILCYSCNASLRVLGHGNEDKVEKYVQVFNEARQRAINSGMEPSELPEMTLDKARQLAGLGDHEQAPDGPGGSQDSIYSEKS